MTRKSSPLYTPAFMVITRKEITAWLAAMDAMPDYEDGGKNNVLNLHGEVSKSKSATVAGRAHVVNFKPVPKA